MSEFHLAQINIARMLAPIDDPVMENFVAQLPPINALAEESPGFVRRLQSEGGDATSIKVYDDDMIMISTSRKVNKCPKNPRNQGCGRTPAPLHLVIYHGNSPRGSTQKV